MAMRCGAMQKQASDEGATNSFRPVSTSEFYGVYERRSRAARYPIRDSPPVPLSLLRPVMFSMQPPFILYKTLPQRLAGMNSAQVVDTYFTARCDITGTPGLATTNRAPRGTRTRSLQCLPPAEKSSRGNLPTLQHRRMQIPSLRRDLKTKSRLIS